MKIITKPFAGRATEDRDVGFEYKLKIGRYVANARKDAGMTQQKLGKLIGIKDSAISAIEMGRNPLPPERYRDFCAALDLNPRTFGKFLLEHTNPWLFGMIYGEDKVTKHHLEQIPERIKPAEELNQ